jgi:hypothetical protein
VSKFSSARRSTTIELASTRAHYTICSIADARRVGTVASCASMP